MNQISSISCPDKLKAALAVLGGIHMAGVALRVARFMWVNYFAGVNMKRQYGRFGDWAVVTGGSDGIGEGMALDLSRRGFNVCVIARTQSKLDKVVEAIERNGVKGLSIAFDFSTAGDREYDALFQKLSTLSIAILVNNVGVCYGRPSEFVEEPLSTDLRLLKVNMEPAVRMTKYVVPRMKTVGGGAVVMLSSFSALTPTPMLSSYAGTKAFCLSFGNALHYELKEFGIDVLTITPNLVSTRMTQEGGANLSKFDKVAMVLADQMACQSLDKLGSACVTAGHRCHAVVEAIFLALPVTMRSNLVLKSLKKGSSK